jgi:hypothetical protein
MYCLSSPPILWLEVLERLVSCPQQCGPLILIVKGSQITCFATEPQFAQLTLLLVTSYSPLKTAPAIHRETRPEEDTKQGPATALHRNHVQSCRFHYYRQEATLTMSNAGGKTIGHPVPCLEFLHAWPCLAWQTTYASFAIKRAFLSHCISTVKQHCGSDDEMDRFWGKTSAKGAMQMEYVIFFE